MKTYLFSQHSVVKIVYSLSLLFVACVFSLNVWSESEQMMGSQKLPYNVLAGQPNTQVPFDNAFVKVGRGGTLLQNSAKAWSCVLDRTSGLLWEVKTPKNKDETYRWGGKGGSHLAYQWIKGANRYKESLWNRTGRQYGDWDVLVNKVNQQGLCGYRDWRVPTLYEMATLVQCVGGKYDSLDFGCIEERADGSGYFDSKRYQSPTIDMRFFPYTVAIWYWTSSADAVDGLTAMEIDFSSGNDDIGTRDLAHRVRLVRTIDNKKTLQNKK